MDDHTPAREEPTDPADPALPQADPALPQAIPALADVDAAHFAALDLRVGRVVEVRPFPEARRPAYQLAVDFGAALGVLETSAQVTGYSTDELVGRLVVGAVNLGPRRIAGFVSRFLVLGAVEADGAVRLLRPDGDPPPGTPVS